MQGFFDEEEITITRGDEAKKRIVPLSLANVGCNECGLYKTCLSPKMPPSGRGRLPILIVAEAPGQNEDNQGTQLVGKSGQLLRGVLKELGFDLDRDFYKTNAIQCRPPENAEPTGLNIAACRKRLMADIERLKPKVIIALGKVSMDALVGDRLSSRMSGLTTTDWSGEMIPDQHLKTWICPTWHPAYLLRNEDDDVLAAQFKKHLECAIEAVKWDLPEAPNLEQVFVLDEERTIVKLLEHLGKSKTAITYDYETTGRKPQRKGHRIYTASVSDGISAWAFKYIKNSPVEESWKAFLTSPAPKIAHSNKFEGQWSKTIVGVWPKNMVWDTMLAAHALHNKKRTNLKFLTYANFGVVGYDDTIDPYLTTSAAEEAKHGANGFNTITEAPLKEVLQYNAMDSLFTWKLWKIQIAALSEKRQDAVRFFVEAQEQLAWAENNGIRLDTEAAPRVQQELTDKMDRIAQRIQGMDELTDWDLHKAFRPNAPADLAHLLFDVLKLKPTEFTPTGKPAADKAALEAFEHILLVKKVLQWRKLQKMRDTYIKGFIRECVDGKIHPFFNLGNIDTFRSGSDSPNFQNIPKRDKEAAAPIRRLLIPSLGNRLIEDDYKAIEVCISACVHKDPNMIRYIEDPSSDMHRDTGMELFLKTADQLTKDDRSVAKNGFVFPEFYGSYFEQIAPDIWHKVAEETKEHLKSQGIKGLGVCERGPSGRVTRITGFYEHVRNIERKFWDERFPVYAAWKDQNYSKYMKKGYVDLVTGFRCFGPMSYNQVSNYPVQGPAFHCLLWTFKELAKKMRAQETATKLIGQIHDAMVLDADPAEEDLIDHWVWDIGTQKIREHWDWIIVPLSIEKSRSEINGNWSAMEDCGLLKGV